MTYQELVKRGDEVAFTLLERETQDRRGFHAAIFHRLWRLRAESAPDELSTRVIGGVADLVIAAFLGDSSLENVHILVETLQDFFPGEDGDLVYELDSIVIPALWTIVEGFATNECEINSEVVQNFLENAQGVVQITLYPGAVTAETDRLVDAHPQSIQEETFLNQLIERCVGLQDAGKRRDLVEWFRSASAGDLWAPLRAG